MQNKQPTFQERITRIEDAVDELKEIAEVVAFEATCMTAAQKRFAERRGGTNRKARS